MMRAHQSQAWFFKQSKYLARLLPIVMMIVARNLSGEQPTLLAVVVTVISPTASITSTDTNISSRTPTPFRSPTNPFSSKTTTTPTPTPEPTTPLPTPTISIIGFHTVLAGETVFCIARAYGVRPDAIAQANGLLAPSYTVLTGITLRIPAVRWLGIPEGVSCPSQFDWPWGIPPPTATPTQDATSALPPPQPSPTPTLCNVTTLPCPTSNPAPTGYP